MSTRGDIFRVCAELSDSEVDIQTSENNGKLDYAELVI